MSEWLRPKAKPPWYELAEAMEFVRTQMEDMIEDARHHGAREKAAKIERRLAVLEAAFSHPEEDEE